MVKLNVPVNNGGGSAIAAFFILASGIVVLIMHAAGDEASFVVIPSISSTGITTSKCQLHYIHVTCS
jgi:hypothetical protein